MDGTRLSSSDFSAEGTWEERQSCCRGWRLTDLLLVSEFIVNKLLTFGFIWLSTALHSSSGPLGSGPSSATECDFGYH